MTVDGGGRFYAFYAFYALVFCILCVGIFHYTGIEYVFFAVYSYVTTTHGQVDRGTYTMISSACYASLPTGPSMEPVSESAPAAHLSSLSFAPKKWAGFHEPLWVVSYLFAFEQDKKIYS
jgi:hypothetical protein